MITFTEEILNGKLYYFCSVSVNFGSIYHTKIMYNKSLEDKSFSHEIY